MLSYGEMSKMCMSSAIISYNFVQIYNYLYKKGKDNPWSDDGWSGEGGI